MQWRLWLEDGKQVGVYCSDVSGTFDRVCQDLLRRKSKVLRLPRCLFSVLSSWLADRLSQVVVNGAYSEPAVLANSVFQGTVLGPILWNIFFRDAGDATHDEGYIDSVYADDMNAFKQFDQTKSHVDIFCDLLDCQGALHRWGVGNRVCFDAGKESFHILHRRYHSRSGFKSLGMYFDSQLLMHEAVSIIGDPRWVAVACFVAGAEIFFDEGNGHVVQIANSIVP